MSPSSFKDKESTVQRHETVKRRSHMLWGQTVHWNPPLNTKSMETLKKSGTENSDDDTTITDLDQGLPTSLPTQVVTNKSGPCRLRMGLQQFECSPGGNSSSLAVSETIELLYNLLFDAFYSIPSATSHFP